MATTVATGDEKTIRDAIAQRAREIWQERGCTEGHAEEDWLLAESEIRNQLTGREQHRQRRIAVRACGFLYVAEYDPGATVHYHPGDLPIGAQVAVRIEESRIYLKLPGGKELEGRIVSKRIEGGSDLIVG